MTTGSSGLLLGERYRLMNVIGGGTQGTLYRAVDRTPDRRVAIRVLDRPCAELARARWLADVALARGVSHRACVRVLEHGRVPGDGAPWVAMELLQAESLERVLARRTLLPGTARRLIAELSAVLAEAHASGLSHGTIAPARVLLHRTPEGEIVPKLEGFGRVHLVAPVAVVQDVAQAASRDVFALGALLRLCVTVAEAGQDPALDPSVSRLLEGCLCPPDARLSAAALADRALFLASRARGGLRDLAKMIRFDETAADPEVMGNIDHVPTIPGGPSRPSMSAPFPAHAVQPLVQPQTQPPTPSRASSIASGPPARCSDWVALPVAASEPDVDSGNARVWTRDSEPLPDVRPRAVKAKIAALSVAAAAMLGAMLALPGRAPSRAPSRAVAPPLASDTAVALHAPSIGAAATESAASSAASGAVPASSAASGAPKGAVSDVGLEGLAHAPSEAKAASPATPQTSAPSLAAVATPSWTPKAEPTKASAPKSEPNAQDTPMPSPPATAGIPLRDEPKPPASAPEDDDPYK